MIEQDKVNSRKKIGFLLAVGVLLLITLLFLSKLTPDILDKDKLPSEVKGASLPLVSVMEIHPSETMIELTLPTSAEAWHITPIWSRVNGYLIRYFVDIGDFVRSGDLLAEIDTPEVDEKVEQAKADLQVAISQRDIAKITTDRWNRLWDKNYEAVSRQEVDQHAANYAAAESAVIANEKKLATLVAGQKFNSIYAPFDGIIIKRSVDIGSLVYGTVNDLTQELFKLAQTEIIRFFVDVPQTYYRHIKTGLRVEVTIPDIPGKIFYGSVTRYAKALTPNARTMQTEIDIENNDWLLYPGLFGQAKFIFRPEGTTFRIPATSVITGPGLPQVAIVDDNDTIHMKEVSIGLDYGTEMEITSGLAEGDRIILRPTDRIREGIKVDVTESKTLTPSELHQA